MPDMAKKCQKWLEKMPKMAKTWPKAKKLKTFLAD
jgi:hypothetical protein